jgi:hypothetical protein
MSNSSVREAPAGMVKYPFQVRTAPPPEIVGSEILEPSKVAEDETYEMVSGLVGSVTTKSSKVVLTVPALVTVIVT